MKTEKHSRENRRRNNRVPQAAFTHWFTFAGVIIQLVTLTARAQFSVGDSICSERVVYWNTENITNFFTIDSNDFRNLPRPIAMNLDYTFHSSGTDVAFEGETGGRISLQKVNIYALAHLQVDSANPASPNVYRYLETDQTATVFFGVKYKGSGSPPVNDVPLKVAYHGSAETSTGSTAAGYGDAGALLSLDYGTPNAHIIVSAHVSSTGSGYWPFSGTYNFTTAAEAPHHLYFSVYANCGMTTLGGASAGQGMTSFAAFDPVVEFQDGFPYADQFEILVSPNILLPAIEQQPQSRTNAAGTAASFSVGFYGDPPLTFQWRKNGIPLSDGGNLSGVHDTILTVSHVLGGDAGGYSVVISNNYGHVTSAVATLVVTNDPSVTLIHPAAQWAHPGQSATLNLIVLGTTSPADFQCRRNGTNVPATVTLTNYGSATSYATLTLPNLQGPDAGNYDVVLTNAYGSATSEVVLVHVNLATADSFAPTIGYGDYNAVIALAVQADGKVLMGGEFTEVSGQGRQNVARVLADGNLDTMFNPGANGRVFALAVQPDGKILAGGAFYQLGGAMAYYLGRLNSDGSLDSTFSPQANGFVACLAVQADGKILVGGGFTSLNGQSRLRIGRLNADGTLDSSFNPGAGGAVYTLALQPDGQILVGGDFPTCGGQSRTRIARLNSNGSLDGSFNPGANAAVYCLAVQPDGRILVGGNFTSCGAAVRTFLARLDANGAVDAQFNPYANSTVSCLALQADGRIVAGGTFTNLCGQSHKYIGRLLADGTVDNSFFPEAGGGVASLAVLADGRLLAGGGYTNLGGQARQYLGRLTASEPVTESLTVEDSVIIWLRGGPSPEVWRTTFDLWTNGVYCSASGAGARIPGGWQLTNVPVLVNATLRVRGFTVGGIYCGSSWFVEQSTGYPVASSQPSSQTNNAGSVASFSVTAAGTAPQSYHWCKGSVPIEDGADISGTRTPILTLSNVLAADGGYYSVIISNSFGSVTSQVATLNVVDPCLLTQPASQIGNLGDTVVFGVSVAGTLPLNYQWRKDGDPLDGRTTPELTLTNLQWSDRGSYDLVLTNVSGSLTSAVALLQVNLALPDTFNPGANDNISALALQPDGKILVGGDFSTLAGDTCDYLGRLNADGTRDTGFSPVVNDVVLGLVVQPDGRILVVGGFSMLGGESRNGLARLNPNGTLDTAFDPAADGSVRCVALQADGKILVGGNFSMLGGQTCNRIGRLHPNGTLDTGFGDGADGGVGCLTVQPDGKILVGGSFSTLGGEPRNYLGRFNPEGTLDTNFNPGADDEVGFFVVQPDGKILVGGYFGNLAGESRNGLGRLDPNGTFDPSFDPQNNGSPSSLALQANGRLLVSGGFTSLGGESRQFLGRLNGDSTLDPAVNPVINSSVGGLALQADGKILAGGGFSLLAGLARSFIGRLHNPDSASQSLTGSGSSITWLRTGPAPEVWRTSFETSTNGTDWINLGAGSRIADGWQWTGSTLSTGITVRARGFVTGGWNNGSSWFIESTTQVSPLSPVVILLNDGNFGFRTNRFGFSVSGTAGQALVLEGSTNLLDWISLSTNTLGSSPLYFNDPESGNFSQRFYRARWR